MKTKQTSAGNAGRAPQPSWRVERVYAGTRTAAEVVADLMKVHTK